MSAPICGARTWVTPDEMATCDRNRGHEGDHNCIASRGFVEWRTPNCRFSVGNALGEFVFVWPIEDTRDLARRLQRQLDALDPDAAVAEAERRMLDAFDRRVRLVRIADLYGEPLGPIEAAAEEAKTAQRAAYDAWLELVEAREREGRWSVRARLPWSNDCRADLSGLHAWALGFAGSSWEWGVTTNADRARGLVSLSGEDAFGEAPTLDAAKVAAEEAARPMIERLITQRESEIAELRRALVEARDAKESR